LNDIPFYLQQDQPTEKILALIEYIYAHIATLSGIPIALDFCTVQKKSAPDCSDALHPSNPKCGLSQRFER
jgi:hypothetical protein